MDQIQQFTFQNAIILDSAQKYCFEKTFTEFSTPAVSSQLTGNYNSCIKDFIQLASDFSKNIKN